VGLVSERDGFGILAIVMIGRTLCGEWYFEKQLLPPCHHPPLHHTGYTGMYSLPPQNTRPSYRMGSTVITATRLACCPANPSPATTKQSKVKKKIVIKSKHTLSIPSISLPLFVPLGPGGGTAELRSSLPRADEPVMSPPRRLFAAAPEGAGGCFPVAARRWESMSFFRLAASSLFSSVNLRRRSCGTQSSHLFFRGRG